MEQERMLKSFDLISHAGNAKSCYMEAVQAANLGDFEKAKEKIEEGNVEYNAAHQMQTDYLVRIANGEEIIADVLMVHSQDHLTSALIIKDMAIQIIFMQEEIFELKSLSK